MVAPWQWSIVGTAVMTGVVSLLVWYARGELASIITDADLDPEQTPTTDDLEEVRDMAERALNRATEAHETAEHAAHELRSLEELLIDSGTDVDDPLLVRIQDRLDSIEEELQRQSRVETERAVSMGRIAAVLEEMEGVDADAVDMDELREKLPKSGPTRMDPDSDDFLRGGARDE